MEKLFTSANIIYESLILFFIMLSSFFSGTETAIVSANRIKLETLAKGGKKVKRKEKRKSKRALFILDNIEDSMGMILIGNNISNIVATAFITYIATRALLYKETQLLVVTIIQTVIFLLVCEVSPKIIARARAEKFLMKYSMLIKFLLVVMRPISRTSLFFAHFLKKVLKLKSTERNLLVSRDEIDILFHLGHNEGIIEEENKEYISEILSIKNIRASQIMKPTIDVASIDVNRGIREVVNLIEKTRFSKIAVYDGRVDNIIGYVFYRDILRKEKATVISDVLTYATYVPSTKSIFNLYLEMQEKSLPVAFVVNEFGAVIGMITQEDIAEEIVGEIHTKDHEKGELIKEINSNKYKINGSLDIDYFKKIFQCDIDKKGFETLAGFINFKFGRIPIKGEKLYYNKFTFIIDKANKRAVESIILVTSKGRKNKRKKK